MTQTPESGWGGTPDEPYAGTPPPPGYPPPGYPPPGQSPGYAGAAPQRTSSLALGAFGCSIAAWFVLPVVAAVVALVLAHLAANEIRDSGGRVGGTWAVTAARVIAWLNIGAAVLAAIGLLLLFGLLTSA